LLVLKLLGGLSWRQEYEEEDEAVHLRVNRNQAGRDQV
jgi:hypothetical protein